MGRYCLLCARLELRFKLPVVGSGWGGIGRRGDPSRFARLELRMLISAFGLHPCGADFRSVCAAVRRSSSLRKVCLHYVSAVSSRRCGTRLKRLTAEWRMGRDSNPRCIAAHTLSKRAHSTTLPPIRKGSPEIKHGSASCCKLGSVFYESAPRNPVHRSQLRFAPPTCSREQDFSVKPLRNSAY